jgi:hypothetical protein
MRNNVKKLSILIAPILVSSFALADDDLLPANRPNFSSNGEVVPLNMAILETGATYQRRGSDLNFSGIEGFLRFGFTKDWEFNVTVPNFVSGASPRGWTDGGFGFVRQLPTCHGWNMVLSAGANVPVGQANLSAGAIDPNFFFSMDHDLSGNLQVTNTFFVNWTNVASKFDPSYGNALMLSKDYGGGLGGFAELYTQFAPGTLTSNTIHFGVTFAHTKDQQADVHFGRNISAGSDTNWFVGFGYSRKLSR